MANSWCYGDERIGQRAARAWSIEELSSATGKPPAEIRKRFDNAGKPRRIGAEKRATIAALLPGRTIVQVAALVGLSPEEVISECERHGLLKAYENEDALPHPKFHENADASEEFKHWTPNSERHLRKRIAEGALHLEIAKELGRTVEAVKSRASDLGLTAKAAAAYTDEQDAILRDTYNHVSSSQIGAMIGKSPDSVRARARALGLVRK